jgi:signal transduction histidine kinase
VVVMLRRRVVLGAVFVATLLFVVWSFRIVILESRGGAYRDTLFDWVLQTSFFAGAVLAVASGAVLWDRQPGNRCALVLIALGVSMAVFYSFSERTDGTVPPDQLWENVMVFAGLGLLRPLLVWLLLAWPTGRLSPGAARLVVIYGVSHVIMVFGGQMLYGAAPLSVADVNWLGDVVTTLQFMVVTVGVEVVVVMVVVRRFVTGPAPSRSLTLPVVIAAVLALAGDLATPLSSLLYSWTREADQNQLTSFGFVVISLDYLRFVAIPLVLLIAAIRRRGVRGASLTVELGAFATPRSLSALIADSLEDPTARVLYPSATGWVDDDGRPTQLASGERRMTCVERDGLVVAGIDHDFVVRPAALEAAAGTLALLAEHRALEAHTEGQVREVRRLRSSVLEAEDVVRRRLERDLHDGAQQLIVALALQARLTEGPAAFETLADSILRARDELIDVAQGVIERVIAERGLATSLEALAATSPFPIDLSAEVPATLHPRVGVTAWFIANEGVSNAAKHADAFHVALDVRARGDVLVVAVSDDGRGGADTAGGGLQGLLRRVRSLGGDLLVQSAPGSGTRLVASLPLVASGGAR